MGPEYAGRNEHYSALLSIGRQRNILLLSESFNWPIKACILVNQVKVPFLTGRKINDGDSGMQGISSDGDIPDESDFETKTYLYMHKNLV